MNLVFSLLNRTPVAITILGLICLNPSFAQEEQKGTGLRMRLYKSFPMTRTSTPRLAQSKPTVPEPRSTSAAFAITRAKSLEKSGDYPRAITLLTEAARLFPASKEVYLELGSTLIHERRLNDALLNANLALTKCPGVSGIYRQRANASYLLHDYANTVKDLDAVAKIGPLTADDYFTKANCYGNLGNPKAVLENIGLGLKQDPKNAEAYYLRAKTYKNLNQNDLAKADFNKAMSLEK